jgi:DNA-binding NtrC family response regulator
MRGMTKEEAYDLVNGCIPGKIDATTSASIKSKIGSKLQDGYSFVSVINNYLLEAVLKHDQINIAKDMFRYVFFETLQEDKFHSYLLSAYSMLVEEVGDLVLFDVLGTKDSSKKIDIRHMREILMIAQSDLSVMIVGETGTSKSGMANAIYGISRRRNEKLVSINCAAIPEEMLESELFGVIKGYGGRHEKDIEGQLKYADKGTVFLDELGKMSERLQAKLLKVIEEGKFKQMGKEEEKEVDVRFIAAVQPSNIGHNILPDLLYRFTFQLRMPTLNERLNAAPEMVIENSRKKALKKLDMKEDIKVSSGAFYFLKRHTYKGNFRELENFLIRGIIRASANNRDEITVDDIIMPLSEASLKVFMDMAKMYGHTLEEVELKNILEFAEGIKKDLVERKIEYIVKNGKDIKTTLIAEGLPEKEYQNFRKKIQNITGKGIKEFASKI